MNHNLKTHPNPFQAVKSGLKKAEFRLNDRGFELGDTLTLQEWEPETKSYTGDEISVIITHIQTGYGIPEGYCMISIEILPS